MHKGELVIKRTFRSVPAQRVFDAWTDPATIAQWYGPEGMRIEIHEMDVRAGGSYRLTMHAADGGKFPLRGTYRELSQPGKVVFTWQWENAAEPDKPGEETLVTVDIRAADADTMMTLTHSGFGSEEATGQHKLGWDSTMTKLERQLAA